MNHEDTINLLHDYVRGRLDDAGRQALEKLLANDGALRGEHESVKKYYHDLKTLPEIRAGDDFLLKVRARIERPSLVDRIKKAFFYPLHIKLPIELAATVGLSLFVVVIFNPFAPKIPVVESQFVEQISPHVNSETNIVNDINNNEIDVVELKKDQSKSAVKAKEGSPVNRAKETTSPAKKSPEPEALNGSSMAAMEPAAEIGYAEPMPEKSESARAAAPAAGMVEAQSFQPAAKLARAPARAKSLAYSESEQEERSESAITLTWTPGVSSSETATAKSKVMDYDKNDNTMKSNNLSYIESAALRSGGTFAVSDQNRMIVRITIPSKNIRLFENALNQKGRLQPLGGADLSSASAQDSVEFLITIVER